MEDRMIEIRKQVAQCLRQFLKGHVSCDHLIEEFKHADDSKVREIIELIEKETEKIDKYEIKERRESEFKETMENLIKKLEYTKEIDNG